MKVLVTGATGMIGRLLCQKLYDQGHEIVVLSRNPKRAKEVFPFARAYAWRSPSQEMAPKEAFQGVQGVVNLMGENISQRWSAKAKERIRRSRVEGTQNLVQAMNESGQQFQVFVSGSAIGFYPVNQERPLTESAPKGEGFLPDICDSWEMAARQASCVERLVLIRTGIVLSARGGALGKLLPLFKLGLGGPVGSGKQMMSWIHIDDMVNVLIEAVTNEKVNGPLNAVAPKPVSNKEFARALGQALGRPAVLPAPSAAVKLATGEMSTIILDGQEVTPAKLEEEGFRFKFSDVGQALKNLCQG